MARDTVGGRTIDVDENDDDGVVVIDDIDDGIGDGEAVTRGGLVVATTGRFVGER